MSCCVERVDGQTPGGGGAFVPLAAEYELEWADLGAGAVARGAFVHDGIDFYSGPDPLPANSSITITASGLVMDCTNAAAGTTFTESVNTAMWVGFRIGSIYDLLGIDCTALLRIESYASAMTIATNAYFLCGTRSFTGAAGTPAGTVNGQNRIQAARHITTGGEAVFNSVGNTNGPNQYEAGQPGPDVIGVAGLGIGPMHAIGGFWNGAWPAADRTQVCNTVGVSGPFVHALNWVVVALATGTATGLASSVTVERTRFRAYQYIPW